MSNKEMVRIDGSLLEGGGQILRISITISALKQIPIHIYNIRAGRSKPGLMEQHLKGVELLRNICNAKLEGATLGSTEIKFWPNSIQSGYYTAPVKTAGSISLLLQVALPCVLFGESDTTLKLQGGTNAEMAPQIDYTTEVFKPVLEKFGASFDFDLIRRGYYPRGGGEVVVKTHPIQDLQPVQLTEFGIVTSIYGWSFVAGTLPIKLAHLMADSAVDCLKKVCGNVKIDRYKEDRSMAPDNGSGIILVAETDTGCIIGADALGKRNERAEDTGTRAAQDLFNCIQDSACVDTYCQDQVIILMALAKGQSKIKVGPITMHTKTAIHIIEMLTSVRFTVMPSGANGSIIECSGS